MILGLDTADRVQCTDPMQWRLFCIVLCAWVGGLLPFLRGGQQSSASNDAKKNHWAFQPLRRPSLPSVVANDWSRNPIDQFILARLVKEKLPVSPPADARTLLRRLKFDLLGLPPTPEELDDFVRECAASAKRQARIVPDAIWERWVDRYLASPHFGERWARHWLDVVRFAESDGFETNQPRASAWPYRDWVIKAFNDDMPYNRFVMAQIAGDRLGADEATAFLVGGPVDRVKSPDIVLTLQQRADELHDMIGTTGTAFLGLTVGCARCHNHVFDPISQLDYYGFKAMFAGVQHGERPMKRGDDPGRQNLAERLRQQLAALDQQIRDAEPLAQANGPAGRRAPVSALHNIERFAPVSAKFVRFTILATNASEPCIDELEIFTSGSEPRNVALGAKPTSSGDYPGAAIHKLEHINDGKYGNGRSWISNEQGKGWVQLELPKSETIERIEWARDREGRYADRLAVRYCIDVAVEPGKWQPVASSEDRMPFGKAASDAPLTKLLMRRADLEKRLRDAERAPLVYAGTFTAPETTHRLHRGDPLQKRELVAPTALADFGPKLQLAKDAPESERRLSLAKWLVDPHNPLTARVIVNRLWHYHFGTGIVSTPSDFGLNGGKPSHPELLDWLAFELAEDWSLKRIHRLIVTSATFRQSSKANDAGLAADAQTRLLWRKPPRRLEAEPLRDAILSTSGKLDLRVGGPGFDLFEPNANYVKVYNPRQEFGPAEWRRMIYQSKWRMQLDDIFGGFDCPDAGQIAPRRTSSTTPLQALSLLNSRFLLQQAGFLAERLQKEASGIEQQVRRGFHLAFGREPSSEECAAAVQLIRAHGLAMFCRALFNANEFVFTN